MKYLLRRTLSLVATVLFISLLVFAAFNILPGDPVSIILGTDATPERVAALSAQLGLDKPLHERYFSWIINLFKGDMGISIQYQVPVISLLLDRFGVSMWLIGISMVLTVIFTLVLGITSARFRDGPVDRILSFYTNLSLAIPPFFLSMMLILLFGLTLRWFRPGAYIPPGQSISGFLSYMIYPAIAIAIPKSAALSKFLRASVVSETALDYVRTARSKGLGEWAVLIRHILKNVLVTMLTLTGMTIADLLGGSIIIEQIFGVPGLGRLLVSSIGARDFMLLQSLVVFITFLIVVINYIVDLLYRVIDPRVRLN